MYHIKFNKWFFYFFDGCINKYTNNNLWTSFVDDNFNYFIYLYIHLFDYLNLMKVNFKLGYRVIGKFNYLNIRQNNCSEFISLIMTLLIPNNNDNIKIIYSDSQLIFHYWSKNNKTKINIHTIKLSYINECFYLYNLFEKKMVLLITIPIQG